MSGMLLKLQNKVKFRCITQAPFRSEKLSCARVKKEFSKKVLLTHVLSALKACRSLKCLETGKRVHSDAVETGLVFNATVSRNSLHMFVKCGSLLDARAIFDSIENPSLACWTALMTAYASKGDGEQALKLFEQLKTEGYGPDERTLVAALMGCSDVAGKETGIEVDGKLVKVESLEKGRALHAEAVSSGFEKDIFLATTLVNMYAKCGNMVESRRVFDKIPMPKEVACWNSLIQGYADNGEEEEALRLFQAMQSSGCQPDSRTFLAALLACGIFAAEEECKQVDGRSIKVSSLEKGVALQAQAEKMITGGMDLFLASSLVAFYAKCGSMVHARVVFEKVTRKDVVIWNSLVLGYVLNDEPDLALELFSRMQTEGWSPIPRTYVAALMACSALAANETGKLIENKVIKTQALERTRALHSQASRSGCELEIYVGSTLVDSYSSCGSPGEAQRVFDQLPAHAIATWNSLMLGYSDNGEPEKSLELFELMQSRGCPPDGRSFVAALMACGGVAEKEEFTWIPSPQPGGQEAEVKVRMKSLERAMAIHSQALKLEQGVESLDVFVSSSLVELYLKCGSLVDARAAFDRSRWHNVVVWTSLMIGYAEMNEAEVVLQLHSEMRSLGKLGVNTRSYIAALMACGSLGSLHRGREIHAEILRSGSEQDLFVGNSLVDFYTRCGSLTGGERVLDEMVERNVVSWSSMIGGYSREGEVGKVAEMVAEMKAEGVDPNGIICLSVLAACSHAGMVDRGVEFLRRMRSGEFAGVVPRVEHFHCVIDMLGRADRMEEAVAMVEELGRRGSGLSWRTLLGACCRWGNVEIGKKAFEKVVEMEDGEGSAYVLMCNIYRSATNSKEACHIPSSEELV